MTITLIDTVTPDVGLKTVGDKINSNFTDTNNAASKLVGTNAGEIPTNGDLPDFGTASEADVQASPSDATAGAVLNNETTHIGGEVNYTGSNYQPESFDSLGYVMRVRNLSGSSIANGAIVDGSLLRAQHNNSSGGIEQQPVLSGDWICLGGVSVANNNICDFSKVAD